MVSPIQEGPTAASTGLQPHEIRDLVFPVKNRSVGRSADGEQIKCLSHT